MRPAQIIALLLLASPALGGVVINEIAFDSSGPDWVELYNSGPTPADLTGWRLDDGDTAAGNEITVQFPAAVPAGAFLLVYIEASGPSDVDFSDGSGVYYAGTAPTVNLAASEDELGLFSGAISSATLVDFTAWCTDGSYGGAADQAVAGGQWPAGGFLGLSDLGSDYSIGRDADGIDGNAPEDFRVFPRPSPGAGNRPPPSPYGDSLRAEPDSFSPEDPSLPATRIYFQAPSPEHIKTIRVWDVRGRAVRTLLEQDDGQDGNLAGQASGFVTWDGRDSAGAAAPVGVYPVTLETVDPGGGRGRARTVVAIGNYR